MPGSSLSVLAAPGIALVGVPMLHDLAVLHTEHIEPKGFVMLTVGAGPALPHVYNDHVIFADHIQQLPLVVGRKPLREASPKCIHKPFESGGHLWIVLKVVRA